MHYDYRINFDDLYELTSIPESEGEPYVSGAVVSDCTSNEARLTIGGTVSNKLSVIVHDAPTTNFDGMRLMLEVKSNGEAQVDTADDVVLNVSDLNAFINDMDVITGDENADKGTDIVLTNIGDIVTDPDTKVKDYDNGIEGTDGSNTEVPENNNYRDEGADIVGSASTDTEELTDWIKFGTYYVIGSERLSEGTYRLTALDGFINMGEIYEPGIVAGTIAEYYADFTSQLADKGIEVNAETFPDVAISWSGKYTYREAAGYFASLIGGYATFGREGYLDIRPYMKNTYCVYYGEVVSYEQTTDNTIDINAVACDLIPNVNATDYLRAGEDDTVEMEFVNPFMTQELLDSILEMYLYTTYQPCRIVCDYNWQIQSGDFIEVYPVESEESVWVCLTNVIVDLDAGTCEIESAGNSETLANNKNISKTMRDIINAGKTATNYITEDETGALVIRRDIDNYNVRIDADSLDIRNGDELVATFGEVTTVGKTNPITIEDGAIRMGEAGELYIPNPDNILIRYPGEEFRPARMVRRSGLTTNGWAWEISTITKRYNIGRGDDSMLTAYAVDTYTPTSGNTQFVNGLYYKDTTKSIASLINDTEGDWQYWEGQPHIIAQANGNTGSGYVSVWRSYLDVANKVIRTRLVSNSANAMGTVTIAYELRMMMCYFDESDDFE